ncbi:hypothetical protein Dda_7245 [Drechslerella dactyloides]|uniref:Uncharacterized protein n=1 Tax=Drechslerella dactyloides TaxID=74499 RepID=A0AAD6ITP2_DREDA|nr:hypothetical protein Dda_7245 [Drechslerella dactyloides]
MSMGLVRFLMPPDGLITARAAEAKHWDRLNARIPPYRDNQPRITAWDLFHLATPPNVPPSAPNLTLSESARHSLTPSAQAAILTPEDDFPQSYAIFRLMSPNFSNEYHPVVAEHIRAWGELENRIANEPRYSPSFYTLLAQYHNARYKAKRMTELDRQSRGAGLSVQGADEYFHLLSNPGPFDVPSTSNVTSPGVGGNVRGAGSSSAAFGNPNLAHIGTSLSRVASLGNFLSSGPGSGGVGSREGDAVPTLASTGDNRASVSNISRASSTTATPPSRGSPSRRDLRRGNSPFEDSARTHANQTQQQEPSISATRPSAVDREREQDRDRETGRITAVLGLPRNMKSFKGRKKFVGRAERWKRIENSCNHKTHQQPKRICGVYKSIAIITQNRLPGNGGNGPALGNWFSSGWPASSHHHSNAGIRSPEAGPAHAFGMPPEDEPSSNSDDDYEDMIPMEEDGFYNVTDNFIPRLSGNDEQPSTSRRASRLRRQYGHTPDELSRAPGLSGPPHGPNRNSVAEIQSRMERSRRFREREADLIRSRHTEAIRDIASLVGGVMPNRWNREHSSNGGSNGGRNGTNVSQAPRTLDHPQRPDIMKDEDMKIMADCKFFSLVRTWFFVNGVQIPLLQPHPAA